MFAWSHLHYHTPITAQQILGQSLWYNSHIRVRGQLLWSCKAFSAGMRFISDVWGKGQWLSYVELRGKFPDISIGWLEYYQICDAIPKDWKNILIRAREKDLKPAVPMVETLVSKHKMSKHVYYQLIVKEDNLQRQCGTWAKRFGETLLLEHYHKAFEKTKYCTIATKLRDFQYRLLANLLVFNVHLKRWSIKSSDNCTFCEKETETTMHCLVNCDIVRRLWEGIFEHIQLNFPDESINITVQNVILGTVHKRATHVINLIVLLTKRHVYVSRCRQEKPQLNEVVNLITETQDTEWYIAKKTQKLKKHYKKWDSLSASDSMDLNRADLQDYINNYFE